MKYGRVPLSSLSCVPSPPCTLQPLSQAQLSLVGAAVRRSIIYCAYKPLHVLGAYAVLMVTALYLLCVLFVHDRKHSSSLVSMAVPGERRRSQTS
jgi:hypothetical protein